MDVVSIVWETGMADEQTDVQLEIVHLILIANDKGQLRRISELMEISWLFRNCAGLLNDVDSGINLISGGEQPKLSSELDWKINQQNDKENFKFTSYDNDSCSCWCWC